MNRPISTLFPVVLALALFGRPCEVHAQHETPLAEPGNAIFGAVQEVIQKAEADTTVDWSEVDLERLRRHLIDMHRAATEIDVVYQHAIPNGVLVRVAPTDAEAQSSLVRVLQAHPMQLEREAEWTMEVETLDDGYELRVTTSDPADVTKIRALGYIGLLAYGAHHQQHHWMIATGQHPH